MGNDGPPYQAAARGARGTSVAPSGISAGCAARYQSATCAQASDRVSVPAESGAGPNRARCGPATRDAEGGNSYNFVGDFTNMSFLACRSVHSYYRYADR
jgi:hypothetical protein